MARNLRDHFARGLCYAIAAAKTYGIAVHLFCLPGFVRAADLQFEHHFIVSETIAADGAVSVVTADIDGDNDLDLLSASFLNGRIIWYENDGREPPAFIPHIVTESLANPTAVRAADLDRDGDIDIIASSSGDDKIVWFENSGAHPPAFDLHVITEDPDEAGSGVEGFADSPSSIFAADLDGDGDPDLLSASFYDGKIAWWANNGAIPPVFTPTVITNAALSTLSVIASDVDSDGDMDVLATSRGAMKLIWFENNGQSPPSFAAREIETENGSATSVAAADLDGDGDMDAAASFADDILSWFENDGASPPAFTEHNLSIFAAYAENVMTIDMDGDGDVDVVSASKFDDKIAWHENDGQAPPNFAEHVITMDPGIDLFDDVNGFADGAFAVHAADLDGDGDIDVMSASFDDDKIAWYESDGQTPRGFTAHAVNASVDGPLTVHAADLDADGDMDIISASFQDARIAWYENQGGSPPVFTSRTVLTGVLGAESIFAADLDADGDLDFIGGSTDDNRVIWFENDGRALPFFTAHTISYRARHCESVYAADLDGDGDMDIMSASSLDDKISWYENSGGPAPFFAEHILTVRPNSLADSPLTVRAVDLDADGDQDVIWASFFNNTIGWFENTGATRAEFTPRVVTTETIGARSVYPADLDGDGDIDLATASFFDNKIAWFENDGKAPPSFSQHIVSTNAIWANWVHADDVDGDGDIDLLSASLRDKKIAWYENLGGMQPTFEERTLTMDADGAWSVTTADFNGDGSTDILYGSFEDDKVAWFENLSGGARAAVSGFWIGFP